MPITQYPRIWLNWLFPPLRSWERTAIEAWMQEAETEIRTIVQSQLKRINLAQRSAKGRVVELYYIESGTAVGDFDRRLPVAREEVILGRVDMTIENMRAVCQLVAVNGRLFSLEFDRVPRLLLWKPSIRINSADALMLPLKPAPETLKSLLPSDYGEILKGGPAAGSLSKNASVLRLDQIYASTFEQGRFWLFAEISDLGMLGVRAEGADRQVYLLSYDGRRVSALGSSAKLALERAIREFGNK